MVRRCLGKGSAKDKLVLNTAVWQVLNAKEEEEMPTEMEETVPNHTKKEKTNMMVSCTSDTNCRVNSSLERFTKETKLTFKHK